MKSFSNREHGNLALHEEAASQIVRRADEAVQNKGIFTLVLAGGSTPRRLYTLLAGDFRNRLAWDRIHFFWGDERHVPPDHAESNYRLAQETLLARVPVLPEQVHRIRAENPKADQVAEQYCRELRDFFHLERPALPRFDLVLLGLGADGHTASLFPGSPALQEENRWVVANWVEKFPAHRITMTAPLLNNSASILFLVQGEEKAGALREVLFGEDQPERLPAQLIQPGNGEVRWLVDHAAASLLPTKS